MQQLRMFDDRQRFEAWKEYHRDNPRVWRIFQHFAEQALTSGRDRMGARMIGERIRWYTTIESSDAEFKINDHHWPYYARLLAGTDERFDGFFVFKDKRFDATVGEIVEAHHADSF